MSEEKEKIEQTEQTLGLLEKTGAWIRKYGLKDIFLTIMVLFLVIVVGRIVVSPETLFKKMEDIKQKAHTESVMKRLNNEPKIREAIVSIRSELKADRVYILETHNGGTNLSNLPFLYVDLSYAEPRNEASWMEEEYKNVRLSRFPWATEVFMSTFWYGDIDSLEELDPELYFRLKNEGVMFMADLMLWGENNPCGVLGVVFTGEEHPDIETIKRVMLRYGTILSGLLNNE